MQRKLEASGIVKGKIWSAFVRENPDTFGAKPILAAIVVYSADHPKTGFAKYTWANDFAIKSGYHVHLETIVNEELTMQWGDVVKQHEKHLDKDWERFVKNFRKSNKKSGLPPRPTRLIDDQLMTIYTLTAHCVQMSLFGDPELFNTVSTMGREDLIALEGLEHAISDYGDPNSVYDGAAGSSAAPTIATAAPHDEGVAVDGLGVIAFLPENFPEMFADYRVEGEDIIGDILNTDNIREDPKVIRLHQHALKLRDQVLSLQRYSGEQTKSLTHGENVLREVNSTNAEAIAATLLPKIKALEKRTTDPEVLRLLNDMVVAITTLKEDFSDRVEAAVGKALGEKFPLMMATLSNLERIVGQQHQMLQQQAQQQQTLCQLVQQLVQVHGQERQVQVPQNVLSPPIFPTGQHLLGSTPTFLAPPSLYAQVNTPMKYPIPPPGLLTPTANPNEVYAAQVNARRAMSNNPTDGLNDNASELRRRLQSYSDSKRVKR